MLIEDIAYDAIKAIIPEEEMMCLGVAWDYCPTSHEEVEAVIRANKIAQFILAQTPEAYVVFRACNHVEMSCHSYCGNLDDNLYTILVSRQTWDKYEREVRQENMEHVRQHSVCLEATKAK